MVLLREDSPDGDKCTVERGLKVVGRLRAPSGSNAGIGASLFYTSLKLRTHASTPAGLSGG